MLKYSDEELAGKRGYDLIHPDDCNYYSAAHQERTSYHSILIIIIIIIIIVIITVFPSHLTSRKSYRHPPRRAALTQLTIYRGLSGQSAATHGA